MDEKTEELRDIFTDIADDETVTESQSDTHGSLASEADVAERLHDAVADMQDRLDFQTDLDTDALATVVRRFYAGDPDADIADELDTDADPETVRDARLDLHLVRDDDAPLDADAVRDATDDPQAADPDTVADELDADSDDAADTLDVVRTRDEIQRTNDRYRAEFENTLRDRELTERLTSSVHEDGLDDATDGQETDMDI
jgi:hypothetical protein